MGLHSSWVAKSVPPWYSGACVLLYDHSRFRDLQNELIRSKEPPSRVNSSNSAHSVGQQSIRPCQGGRRSREIRLCLRNRNLVRAAGMYFDISREQTQGSRETVHKEGNLELGEAERSGLGCGSVGEESTCYVGDLGSIPWSGRSPGGRHGSPLQYSCLENPHGQRILAGCSPGGCKESDATERLSRAHTGWQTVSHSS